MSRKRECACPFPDMCGHADRKIENGCKVWQEKPFIFCSHAELSEERVRLEESEIREYLDRHIVLWHAKAITLGEGFATFYRDAYQKLRKDFLGSELQLQRRLEGRTGK